MNNSYRKYSIIIVILIMHNPIKAQDNQSDFLKSVQNATRLIDSLSKDTVLKDTIWKTGGFFNLTFAQAHFNKHWVAGGVKSYTVNSRLNIFANYKKGNWLWENTLDLAYGMTKQDKIDIRKSDDLIEFNSSIGYAASKRWFYTAVLNLKSQFYEGRNYIDADSSVIISDFLSPGYLNLGAGMEYRHSEYFSVFASVVNAKLTYVNDTMFSERYSIEEGKQLRTELGFIAKIKYKRNLTENISFQSKLDLFSNYLEKPQNIDVSWEVLINMKVFKVLSVNLNTHLIYDDNIDVDDETPGKQPRIQFKEIFGLGLAYQF